MTEEGLISSLYPLPPPYIKFFTEENQEKLKEYKKNNDYEFKPADKELEFLIPPKKPESEFYRSFGNIWQFNDKIPKLEDVGIPQLYEETEGSTTEDSRFKIEELKKLLKSLLLNFLELIGVMSVAPNEFAAKVENIRTILINIHHLLNEYRPHQSRESLILLLEKQIETKRNEVEEIENVCKDVEEKIKRLVAIHIDNISLDSDQKNKSTDNNTNDVTEEKVVEVKRERH